MGWSRIWLGRVMLGVLVVLIPTEVGLELSMFSLFNIVDGG